jgi:hypothetical protein
VQYIFSLLGMQLFANRFHFSTVTGYALKMNDLDYGTERDDAQRTNFDTLYSASLLIFQVLTGEDWNVLMYQTQLTSGYIGVFFFLAMVVVGSFLLLNIFLSILLREFARQHEVAKGLTELKENEGSTDVSGKLKEATNLALGLARTLSFRHRKDAEGTAAGLAADRAAALKEKEKQTKTKKKGLCVRVYNRGRTHSLFIFQEHGRIRMLFRRLVHSPWFERVVLSAILVSTVLLGLDNPLNNPHSTLFAVIKSMDRYSTACTMHHALCTIHYTH